MGIMFIVTVYPGVKINLYGMGSRGIAWRDMANPGCLWAVFAGLRIIGKIGKDGADLRRLMISPGGFRYDLHCVRVSLAAGSIGSDLVLGITANRLEDEPSLIAALIGGLIGRLEFPTWSSRRRVGGRLLRL